MRMLCENIGVSGEGRLLFAGQEVSALAGIYGTPLYLVDEDRVREKCRIFREAFAKYFGSDAGVLYASKANCFKRLLQIVQEEGLGADVVSVGEIYTAQQAGFDLAKTYFHSNNKTDEDVRYAIQLGVGTFVADNREEIEAIEREAAAAGIIQEVLLRITPGIDPHTYAAVTTGMVDSKFGSAIETGQAEEMVRYALAQPHVRLMGFHCHLGSQVFAEDVFERAARVMIGFMADMREKLGYTGRVLDLGGGYGVRYLESDPHLDIETKVCAVAQALKTACAAYAFPQPRVLMEPGRAIIADAGMTLYTVGTVKKIPGYKNYVSVDGSMADAPRHALYGAKYTVYAADKMREAADLTCSVVGRCCESGDIITPDAVLPASVGRGDILAVASTGAYHHAMSSNYNRLPRPATVLLHGGRHELVIRGETLEDLLRCEL